MKSLYLRRCKRCFNFMNWLVRPDGSARCQDCGAEHEELQAEEDNKP